MTIFKEEKTKIFKYGKVLGPRLDLFNISCIASEATHCSQQYMTVLKKSCKIDGL